jgi:hypothetical protein
VYAENPFLWHASALNPLPIGSRTDLPRRDSLRLSPACPKPSRRITSHKSPITAFPPLSPLDRTLTKNAPVSPLELTLTKYKDLKSHRIILLRKRPGVEGMLLTRPPFTSRSPGAAPPYVVTSLRQLLRLPLSLSQCHNSFFIRASRYALASAAAQGTRHSPLACPELWRKGHRTFWGYQWH